MDETALQLERTLRLGVHLLQLHKDLTMPWVTPPQAALIRGVYPDRIYKLIAQGRLRGISLFPEWAQRSAKDRERGVRDLMVPLEDVLVLPGKLRAGRRGVYGAERDSFTDLYRRPDAE